jgi:hypothetical protein
MPEAACQRHAGIEGFRGSGIQGFRYSGFEWIVD